MVKKRGGKLHIQFWCYGVEVGISTPAKTVKEARRIEEDIKTACKVGDASWMEPRAKEVCSRFFRNRGWKPLPGLAQEIDAPEETLTLWRGIEKALKHPDVRNSSNRQRHEQCFVHVVQYFGKGCPLRSLRTADIKEYFAHRVTEGAAPSTISKEKVALSLMFKCLMEYELIDRNPARDAKAPRDLGQREIYISLRDFQCVVSFIPGWMKPIAWCLFYTGMRRKEALSMNWENVDLDTRIITLEPGQVKERKKKRIPISRLLVPVLVEAGKVRAMSGTVFHISGRSPSEDSLRKPWTVAVSKAGLDPAPTIHDIRHVAKTNMMRSGMDFELREAILGHRVGRTMMERYGRISDEDLVRAIDGVNFDNGKTEILVGTSTRTNREPRTKYEQNCSGVQAGS
ncbi:MAG: tyrosine-type recombinase/integrase [Thermodesulfobacteriota bacterium]